MVDHYVKLHYFKSLCVVPILKSDGIRFPKGRFTLKQRWALVLFTSLGRHPDAVRNPKK